MSKTKLSDDWRRLPLWPHQIDAVTMLELYFESHTGGSALVRMPTGTGKTRVIATATRCLLAIKTSLVICPYRGLSDQLSRDLRADPKSNQVKENEQWCQELDRFWPRKVLSLIPSTLTKTIAAIPTDGAILVTTIQTLQQIYANDREGYAKLRTTLDAVFFDEGHREPAPEWATAVRELGKPSVLITATPYRNDLQMFAVDRKFIFVFTHDAAARERYIRRVKVEERSLPGTAQAFVDELLIYVDATFSQKKPAGVDNPRVIIRCESQNSVTHICKALELRHRTFLGIHDRYGRDHEEGRLQKVPDPRKRTETFWVHQFKLLEGIDNPEFCLLAVFEPLRNARALVQQVGRIIRNTKRAHQQTAHVLCRTGDRQNTYWEKYLEYERDYEKNPELYDLRQMFDTFVDLQPEYQYYDRDFRNRFGIGGSAVHENYLYRPSALILEHPAKVTWESLLTELEQEWRSGDRDVRNLNKPDEDTLVLSYVVAQNSPILSDSALTEIRLGFCILRRSSGYVFFSDSMGSSSFVLGEHCERVPPDQLEGLFSGETAKLSYVSLINSDLGSQSTRRRTIQAASVENTAPGLSDHGYFPSSVIGSGGELQSRRYVGFSRSRISDRTRRALLYTDYCIWTDTIAQELKRQRTAIRLFARYARFSSPPDDPDAVNVLLDISDVMSEFVLTTEASRRTVLQKSLEVEDVCLPVKNGEFILNANEIPYRIGISYEAKRKRYILDSPMLEAAYQAEEEGGRPENLIHYLNRTQAFRIVPKSYNTIYAWGRFYRPRNPLTGPSSDNRIELTHILNPRQELSRRTSEKGEAGSANTRGWAKGSLFHLVATRGLNSDLRNEFDGIDRLVCDDLQKECCDFLAADTKQRRVIFIHAKAQGSKLSASVLQDVCGQANKNLTFLSPYNQDEPPNLGLWDGAWNGGKIGTVNRRILIGKKRAAGLWAEIQVLLRDPATRREVWILLGDTLSLDAFEKSRQSPEPEPETVQILFLLQSTWANVSSVGAVLKVFCSL